MSFKKNFSVLLVGVSLALSIGAGGCGDDAPSVTPPPAAPGTGAPGEIVVNIPNGATGMGDAAYGANPLSVTAGTRVTWVNEDSMPHTATSDTGIWDSGTLQPGDRFTHTFDTPGTYPYFCEIHGHASMSGVIEVTGTSPSPSPSPTFTTTPMPSPFPTMSGMPGMLD
jgi:plastocyanin